MKNGMNHNVVNVNIKVESIKQETQNYATAAATISGLTSSLLDCTGIEMVFSGGSDYYSNFILECEAESKFLTDTIRSIQLALIKYDQSEQDLKLFLNSVTAEEWAKLGYSEIEIPKNLDDLSKLRTSEFADAIGIMKEGKELSGWDSWLNRMALKSEEYNILQMAGATIGLTGAKLIEGAVGTVGTWIDGIATGVAIVGRGLKFNTTGLENWIATEHVDNVANSIYKTGIFDAAIYEYDGTAAKVVETVGNALPYMAISGAASYKGVTKVASNTWGAYAKAGLSAAKKEMIIDTTLGTLGGFGEGTAQGLQEGMDLGDAIAKKGLESAKRELVLGAAGNVAGELIGSTAKFAKNTGILNLAEEGAQQATKQAMEGIDGHKLIGTYDDGSLVGNRLADAYQESAENASRKLADLDLYKQGEYDRIVAEETEKVGKNALDTFEKANAGNVDDAYRKVAQQNTEAQIEQQVRETVEKEIRDDIAKKGYSSQTMIDAEFNSPARKAEFDMKLAQRTQDISTQASEILAKQGDGGLEIGRRAVQDAAIETEKAAIEQSARTAAEESVNNLVKNNPSLKESTLKDLQQEAEKQIKNSIEQQKSTLATGLGELSSQKGRNIIGIRNKASEFDKFSSNFGKDALDNATTSARKALNDALDTAQATGTKLTGQELRDIASKAAKESIEISTLTKGSQAAKNALSATNEEFATRLSRLEKGETIDDIIKSSDPKKGTDSSKPDPTKPDSSKPDSSKPDSSKPDSSKPDSSKPDSTKPDSSKPDSSKPDSSKPDSSKPPKKEEVNWEKPVEKTNPETGTKYTETKGKDLQGRDVVESKAKDGSSTVTTVGKQGDDTVEIVESYNKAGVKSQQTTTIKAVDPTTGKVQVKERIVEGLDGTVTERRTWESTNKYTATITDNTGKDKFIKTVTVGSDGETPVNIILKDVDNNLLKTTDITTKTPLAANFKITGDEIEIPGLSKGPIKLDANQYLDINNSTVRETLTTTTKNGVDKVTKKFEFDVNVNGSTEKIKYTVVEQADGTYRISKQFDNGRTRIEISHPKGKAPTIIEETIDSTGKRITTTSRTGKPTIIKTVNPDGRKIIQKGTGNNPTIIKETFDPDNMTKTRETIHNGTTETVIEKYDPQTRTKSYVDEKGNTIRKDKTYDKPTYDKPNSETQPKVDDGKLDNGPGKGENDNRPDTSKDPTKPEIKTEPSKKIDSARNHPILRQIKPNYLGQYDAARYYKNAEFKKINKELYNGELTKLRTSKTKYIEIGKEAVYNKHLSEALEKAGVKNADELGEDLLKQVRKNADDEIAKLSKNKLKKLGKQDIKARCEDNAWKKVDEMLATDAGQKKLTNIGRGHQVGRAAALALLWPKGEGGTGEDYIPTTTPIETVPPTDPYIPPGGGPSGEPSGDGGDSAPSDEITDPSDVTPNETPVSTTATPEQPETLPPEEEVITGITDNQPTTGGGNNWGQTGGGQSFNDTVPPEDDLTDEDTLLGDENLDDLEIEDVYTIPMASDGSYSSVTKDGVNPVPILAGLGLVAAAGVGAKIYMDNKKNNENSDDDEFMDDSEFEEFSSTDSDLIADEWTDETLDSDNPNEESDYERPSFYSDTLGDEI